MIGLWSGTHPNGDGVDDLRRVARDTGTLNARGEPIVLDIGPAGERLGEGVIQALELVTGGAVLAGAEFTQVRSGTRVHFELELDPSRVPQAACEQRYALRLLISAGDGTLLSEQVVDVVIAADGSCLPAM